MVPIVFNLTKKDFKGQKGLFKLNYLCRLKDVILFWKVP